MWQLRSRIVVANPRRIQDWPGSSFQPMIDSIEKNILGQKPRAQSPKRGRVDNLASKQHAFSKAINLGFGHKIDGASSLKHCAAGNLAFLFNGRAGHDVKIPQAYAAAARPAPRDSG